MDRRLLGVVMLIVVALVAVALPNRAGHRIFGTPQVAHVPGAPAEGSCVVAVDPLPSLDEQSGGESPISYPSARYGACNGNIVGEVMSVDLTAHPLEKATINSYASARWDCDLAEVNYVGSIGPYDPARLSTPNIVGWDTNVVVQTTSVGPSAYQRAAGQSWTACIGGTGGTKAYRGRLQNALRTGTLPAIFGNCLTAPVHSTNDVAGTAQLSCEAPHSAEVLGTTQIYAAKTPAEIQESCAKLALRALRSADATRGGRLMVTAYSSNGVSGSRAGSVGAAGSFLACVASVQPPARLSGTLIGLGNGRLPLTG